MGVSGLRSFKQGHKANLIDFGDLARYFLSSLKNLNNETNLNFINALRIALAELGVSLKRRSIFLVAFFTKPISLYF